MIVAGYQSYANRPLCFQNPAFRNEAIRLHRIKLRQFDLGAKEELTPQEKAQYAVYKRADKKTLMIDKILSIAVLVFLVTLFLLIISSHMALQMPAYIVSGFLIFLGKPMLINWTQPRQPLCVTNQSLYELDIIESFYKRMNGIPLNEEEKRNIKNCETEIRWNGYHLNALYAGILLHTVATLLHGILYMFQS